MGKIGPKFSHLLTVRAEGSDPPPPLTVSLTVKIPFFFTSSLTPKIWNSNNFIDGNLNLQALSTQMCFWPLQLLFLVPKATCCVTVAAIKSCHLLVPLLPVAKLAAVTHCLLPTLHHRVGKQQTNIAVVHQTIHIIPGGTGSPSIDIRHAFCVLHVFTFFYEVLGTLKMALLVPLQGGLQKCHSLLEDYGLKGGKRA